MRSGENWNGGKLKGLGLNNIITSELLPDSYKCNVSNASRNVRKKLYFNIPMKRSSAFSNDTCLCGWCQVSLLSSIYDCSYKSMQIKYDNSNENQQYDRNIKA